MEKVGKPLFPQQRLPSTAPLLALWQYFICCFEANEKNIMWSQNNKKYWLILNKRQKRKCAKWQWWHEECTQINHSQVNVLAIHCAAVVVDCAHDLPSESSRRSFHKSTTFFADNHGKTKKTLKLSNLPSPTLAKNCLLLIFQRPLLLLHTHTQTAVHQH